MNANDIKTLIQEADADEIQSIVMLIAKQCNEAHEMSNDQAWLNAADYLERAARQIGHRSGN